VPPPGTFGTNPAYAGGTAPVGTGYGVDENGNPIDPSGGYGGGYGDNPFPGDTTFQGGNGDWFDIIDQTGE